MIRPGRPGGARRSGGREVKLDSQPTSTEAMNSQSLLWAIAEFREEIERLIEEQRALVVGRRFDPGHPEPSPVPTASAPPPLPSVAVAHVSEAEPPQARRAGSRPRPADNPSPTPYAPAAAEPAEPTAAEPARPEDARQRLDALAAKLLDRRMKQTPADPERRRDER